VTSAHDSSGVLAATLRFNQDRKPKLVALKLRRMLEDPFTFFRGTNHLFAANWPSTFAPLTPGPRF
jgi:uncharacterized protein (DUF2252 family)